MQSGILGHLLPYCKLFVGPLALLFELIIGSTEFLDSLLRKELLEGPLLNVLCLVFLEMGDEGYCSLQNRPLVLLAAGYDLGELINTLIDRLPPTAFNWSQVSIYL